MDAETPLSELLSRRRAPCAVPVIGEEQQYVGIISKRMLLQALDREGQTMADQSNPWGTTEAANSAAQSADAWGSTPAPADGGGAADWLNNAPAPAPEHFNIMDPFHKTLIPDSWVTEGIDWVVTHFRPVFGDPRSGGLHPQRLPAADAGHARAGGDCAVLADRGSLVAQAWGSPR